MPRPSWRTGVLVAALGWTAPSLARSSEDTRQQPAPEFDSRGITVRSGLSVYTGNLGDALDLGTFLGVDAEAQVLPLLGLQLGYEGSANGVKDLHQARLWRHNLAAMATVGPILGGQWKPFLGAGVGASYLDGTPAANQRQFDTTFVAEVPLSAGLDYRSHGVTAGARATYRLLLGGDLAPGDEGDGNLVTVGLSLGARF
ncbi:outer membrane beta-barrel protein [Myxococcus landrumensis]|uniref:Outer membrane beta-barrel protein n=1 Tax=Myxococcus landrumensis TaxID=2813577 RepID=A0ABX7NEU6_9BACT|nr:outer membrane beta-barrel protein [Myxococcus landrumus]QSQ17357.1 outer membrane beta-barrel protein [Myxococcus landrumus]